jgi:hypothetical protein
MKPNIQPPVPTFGRDIVADIELLRRATSSEPPDHQLLERQTLALLTVLSFIGSIVVATIYQAIQ